MKTNMPKRKLGKSGLEVSAIGLGCNRLTTCLPDRLAQSGLDDYTPS